MADAGIDESNAKGKLILLPKDSFHTAEQIRLMLCKYFKIKNLGIIISDSGLLPLRNGVIGIAQGYAGLEGVKSYKEEKDIFGRKFIYSNTNVADSLATGATLCMGRTAKPRRYHGLSSVLCHKRNPRSATGCTIHDEEARRG